MFNLINSIKSYLLFIKMEDWGEIILKEIYSGKMQCKNMTMFLI
jgi:hypothetical protein